MTMRIASRLAAGALALSVVALGSGVALAATPVLSDTIKFAGTATASSNGTFTFTSSRCSLLSDGEATAVPCQESGQGSRSSNGISGTATVTSADGTTHWSFTLTPTTTANRYKMVGKGTESDTPDPGSTSNPYPCVVRGLITIIPTSTTTAAIKGTEKVLESSTAP